MTYTESVRFLYSLGNEVTAAKLGLAQVETLLEALGRPHRSGNYIHVAGTNGKGSVSAMLESGLRAAGFRTGLYTSPHLLEPTERIQLGGRPVKPELFTSAFERVHGVAERLLRDGALQTHPTYFETVTAMAFLLFKDARLDWTVLEVGLGGRLDATNVVLPRLCVVTPVDYDHEAFLGRSLEAIAGEKAGILKAGVPAVFAAQRPEAAGVLDRTASQLEIEVRRAADWEVSNLELSPRGSCFQTHQLRIDCPLAGEHQVQNALTAAQALNFLGIPTPAIEEGIRRTSWPGRLERVSEAPEIILDGAHNPAGARALAAYIRRFFQGRRVWIIYGAMRDKAVSEVAGVLFPLADQVILTAPRQSRAVRPEALAQVVEHPHVRTAGDLPEALAQLRDASPEDAVFITGSLFLVAEARTLFA